MMRSDNKWFVYILRLADDTLYTGLTRDPKRRFSEHAIGKGAQYVRRKHKRPFRAFIIGEFDDYNKAEDFERAVKNRGSRARWRLIMKAKEFELEKDVLLKMLEVQTA
jgi:putative endonuclease